MWPCVGLSGLRGLASRRPTRAADYILAVRDPAAWHRENIERNGAAHYSILRLLGAQALARIQVRASSDLL